MKGENEYEGAIILKHTLENVSFQAFIHTIQFASVEEVLPADDVFLKPYIISRPWYTSGRVHYKINPNKLFGNDYLIYSFSEFIESIDYILNDLLLEASDCFIERVDLAIHTTADYDSLFKINSYLVDLYAQKINCNNNYTVIDHRIRNRSVVVKNNRYELEIYNKHIESGRKYWPMTRCEFRFKSLGHIKSQSWQQIINSCVDKSQEFLLSASHFVPEINSSMSTHLVNKYRKKVNCSHCNKPKRLSFFVAQYGDFIYTREILKALYFSVRDRGFKDWFYRFHQSGIRLELISKTEISYYCDLMREAIVTYKGSLETRLFDKPADQKIA